MKKSCLGTYIATAFLMGTLSSCNDSFLERAAIVNISDANFWQSVNDLELYANNFYNQDALLP